MLVVPPFFSSPLSSAVGAAKGPRMMHFQSSGEALSSKTDIVMLIALFQ